MDWITIPSDQLVCHCIGVDKGTIVTAIQGGIDTVAGLERTTGAGGGCGSCRNNLQELINLYGFGISDTTPPSCCGNGCCD